MPPPRPSVAPLTQARPAPRRFIATRRRNRLPSGPRSRFAENLGRAEDNGAFPAFGGPPAASRVAAHRRRGNWCIVKDVQSAVNLLTKRAGGGRLARFVLSESRESPGFPKRASPFSARALSARISRALLLAECRTGPRVAPLVMSWDYHFSTWLVTPRALYC